MLNVVHGGALDQIGRRLRSRQALEPGGSAQLEPVLVPATAVASERPEPWPGAPTRSNHALGEPRDDGARLRARPDA